MHRAGELHELSRTLARRLGVRGFIRWVEAEHTFHCYWEGRWDDALAAIDDYFQTIKGTAGHYMDGPCRAVRSAILLARGRTQEAFAEARLATERSRPVKDPQTINPVLAYEAQAALAIGERPTAESLADELVEAWSATGIRQPIELSASPWVFRELGRSAEVLHALDEQAIGETPWHHAARLIATGELAGAADIFAGIGTVPDEAYTRLKAAEAFLEAGDRASADRQLAVALPLFAQLRAAAWTAEGEALLAASA